MNADLGQSVISIARSLVGSHYINGGYGATTGRSDGCPCRPGSVALIADAAHLNPKKNGTLQKNLAVNAATNAVTQYCVCAGNSKLVWGDGPLSPDDSDLTSYLSSLDASQPSTWTPNFQGLTPRRAYGPGPNGDIGGKLVWGEDCRNKRHFDCVGFISYCYWKATGTVIQLDIKAWATPSPGREVFRLGELTAAEKAAGYKAMSGDVQDGDIIIQRSAKGNFHHIAYVDQYGTVFQAEDTDIGVTSRGKFSLSSPGKNTHLTRIGGGAPTQDAEWPLGWWRIWDGGTWYYYFSDDGVVMSMKTSPANTRKPPAHPYNSGYWERANDATLVVTWNKRPTAKKECVETFWNATADCGQMNANSNLYSPLVATRMV